MKKYRIMRESTIDGSQKYIIEKKSFLGFWYNPFLGTRKQYDSFPSIEHAENYINRLLYKPTFTRVK